MGRIDDGTFGTKPQGDAMSAQPERRRDSQIISGANQHAAMVSALRAMLVGAATARLAVGYFFVEGFGPLLRDFDGLNRIDLLIGNVVNRLTEEQMREMGDYPEKIDADSLSDAEFAARHRAERDQAARETALNLRRTIDTLPHNDLSSDTITMLARWIAEGRLHVRLSTRSRLHAKVTLVSYPEGVEHAPGRAIVGTSNLTLADIGQHNAARADAPSASNLDVLLAGEENYNTLTAWFEHHWSDAQDFRRELFQELGRAWPLAGA